MSPHRGKARTVQVVWVYKVVQLVSKILEIGQAVGCRCCHGDDTFPVALKPCAMCVCTVILSWMFMCRGQKMEPQLQVFFFSKLQSQDKGILAFPHL